MTDRRIEELANEVAREMGQHFTGFRIDLADVLPDGLNVTFSWAHPFRKIVNIKIGERDSDDFIKEAIRRQLIEN
jgi:hypothetical protein